MGVNTYAGKNNLNQYWVKRKEKNIRYGGKYKVNAKEHKPGLEASITVTKKQKDLEIRSEEIS